MTLRSTNYGSHYKSQCGINGGDQIGSLKMIRFVDLSEAYWTDPSVGKPICAFLDTVTDTFLKTEDGSQTFFGWDDVDSHKQSQRLRSLMPSDFFKDKNETYPLE